MSDCNNIIDVSSLDQCNEIDNDSFLIVQKIDSVCRAKISDLVFGADNVDFYPELIEIVNKLDTILSVLQPNSGKWNNTAAVVAASADVWNGYNDSPLSDIADDIKNNIDDWNDTTGVMAANSGEWQNTSGVVGVSAQRWNDAATIVTINSDNWTRAWSTASDGHQAIYEALEVMESMPWFTLYHSDGSAPPIAELWSLYSTVQTNSAGW
jgi:hypothetical protein